MIILCFGENKCKIMKIHMLCLKWHSILQHIIAMIIRTAWYIVYPMYTVCSSEYSLWAVSSWAPRQVSVSVWSSLKSAWERSETRSTNVGRDNVSGCLWMRLIMYYNYM